MNFAEAGLLGAAGAASAYLARSEAGMPSSLGDLSSSSGPTKAATAVVVVAGGVLATQVLFKTFFDVDPLSKWALFLRQFRGQEAKLTSSGAVDSSIDTYNKLHEAEDADSRNTAYKTLVNAYYDLATLFYEWGWGQSFHFAYRFKGESFKESIRRHEYYLGGRLGVSSGSKIVDVGCGVGGPMRNIARFTKANVTGITLNQYQVDRGNEINREQGLAGQCKSVQGDFMEMPFADETYDGAYAIEATCHAPDRVKIYSEVKRVLKPGAVFACYEWCMTDNYDPTNEDHKRWKKQIEEGDGLPDICSTRDCLEAMKAAGFEILEERDLAEDDFGAGGRPWMEPLLPSWNPLSQRFQFTAVGASILKVVLKLLEFCYLAPKGTVKVETMLLQAAFGLGGSGETHVFTPMYLMVGRKPLE